MRRRTGSLAGLASLGASAEWPSPTADESETEEERDLREEQPDTCATEQRRLCEALAQAIVLHDPLPPETAASLQQGLCVCAAAAAAGSETGSGPCPASPTCRVTGLYLALAGDERAGGWLAHLPVMPPAGGSAAAAGAVVALEAAEGLPVVPAGHLGPDTAASECFQTGRTLVWRAGEGHSGPEYADWSDALSSAHAAGASSPAAPAALVTVPLLVPGSGTQQPLGSATFALAAEPGEGEVAALEGLGGCLAGSIFHQTKALWEESLGFLTQVVPPRVVQRMLSGALSLGPLAAASAAPSPPATAAAAAAVAAAAAGETGREGGAEASAPGTPGAGRGSAGGSTLLAGAGAGAGAGAAACPGLPSRLGSSATAAQQQAAEEDVGAIKAALKAAGSPVWGGDGGSGSEEGQQQAPAALDGLLEVKTLRQKWNLEFADPTLEDSFRTWFNTLQTKTDLAVFRYFSVLLVLLMAVLALRHNTTLGDLLAVTHGLLSVVVLGACMLLSTAWYIAHRSTIVAAVRIVSAILLLAHAYTDPGFYSGGLLKGLAGSCSFTLIVNSFRNRLRFSNHLLVQLAKLYACALANAFAYSDPWRASFTYLSLGVATQIQLACALIPSLAVYRLEAGMRRTFLAAGMQSGALQMPSSPRCVTPPPTPVASPTHALALRRRRRVSFSA